jgi:hypothetical protein
VVCCCPLEILWLKLEDLKVLKLEASLFLERETPVSNFSRKATNAICPALVFPLTVH